MSEQKTIGAAVLPPAQENLCRAAETLSHAAADTEKALQKSYRELAQDAEGPGVSPEQETAIEQQLAALKQVNDRLRDTYFRTAAMEDELRARYRDARKSQEKRRLLPTAPANGAIDLEEQRSRHFARGINLYKLLLICFVGSFGGVVIETIWCFLRHGCIESRAGLVYGPFNLLYGVGAVVLTLALYRFRNRGSWLSFLGGLLVGSAVEYVCSWAQELLFGSRSWDYSAVPLNINGRICLLYSCFWGLLGVLWIKDVYPRMAKWILKIPNRAGKLLTVALTVFLLVNSVVSLAAVQRWSQRVRQIPATNHLEQILDERFPDERMERIYANMEFGNTPAP